jgi:hypothetical protein
MSSNDWDVKDPRPVVPKRATRSGEREAAQLHYFQRFGQDFSTILIGARCTDRVSFPRLIRERLCLTVEMVLIISIALVVVYK